MADNKTDVILQIKVDDKSIKQAKKAIQDAKKDIEKNDSYAIQMGMSKSFEKQESARRKEAMLQEKAIAKAQRENASLLKKEQSEVNKTQKVREDALKYEQQTRLAISKEQERQNDKLKEEAKLISKAKNELKLYQAEMDRKSTKLTSGQYGKYVDSEKLGSINTQVSSMNIGSAKDIDDFKTKTKELDSSFKDLQLSAQQSRTGISEFGDNLKHNAVKFLEFYTITGLVVAGLKGLTTAITTVYDLSNALNEIRIVTGWSVDATNELGSSYNKLAKDLSTSTVEVTKSASDLFRQGLNESQVEERLKAIIKYSKISGLNMESSTEIITASANGSGKAVTELSDIFANLGDLTSAGADEIGIAMQKVAGSAQTAGIPFEQLAGQIATVSSITRESASTIGNSFKSLLARYGAIKEKGFNEEDTDNINSVAIALKSIGINATDSAGQLRPFGEVINEVGGKFTTLDGNTQKYIATTLGGKSATLCGNV